jgi:hypothetical protein
VNPDPNDNVGIGRYSNAITALSVNLGAFSEVLDSTGNNVIRIVNTASHDEFDVRASLVGNAGEHIFSLSLSSIPAVRHSTMTTSRRLHRVSATLQRIGIDSFSTMEMALHESAVL